MKKFNWNSKKIHIKTYDELVSECKMILNSEICECGANKEGVQELFMTGDASKMEAPQDNSCIKCGGIGIIER